MGCSSNIMFAMSEKTGEVKKPCEAWVVYTGGQATARGRRTVPADYPTVPVCLQSPQLALALTLLLCISFRLGIDSKTVNSPGITATREASCKNLSILIHFTLLRPSKICPHQPSFSNERSPNDFSASTGSKKRQWTMGPGLSFLNLKTHTLPLCM